MLATMATYVSYLDNKRVPVYDLVVSTDAKIYIYPHYLINWKHCTEFT